MPEHFSFIPLPGQARPPADPPEGYRLQRAGENGYVVISGIAQSAFVVTGDGVGDVLQGRDDGAAGGSGTGDEPLRGVHLGTHAAAG